MAVIQFTHSNRAFYFDYDEYIYDDNSECGIVLYDAMREWLIENGIRYELMWAHKDNNDFSAAIKLNNEEDAIAFKLRWT